VFKFKRILVLFFVLLIISWWAIARSQVNGALTMPTPQIVAPANNSVINGLILIKISIPATVVQTMEVYASPYWLGRAYPQGGTSENWYLSWDTTAIPDGQYGLMAKSTIIQSATLGNDTITTYSQTVSVTINNATQTTGQNQTGTAEENQTPTSTKTITSRTQTGVAPTAQEINNQFNLDKSTWQTVSSITFPKISDNQIDKIEYKVNQYQQEYLVFSGRAIASSRVTLTITSQPIIVTTRADANGNWEYIFDKPLDPGRHKVEVEIIDPNGEKVKSGPFEFLIARAQASNENPTGASLQLIDEGSRVYLNYLLIAGGLIVLAIIILLVIRSNKMRVKA